MNKILIRKYRTDNKTISHKKKLKWERSYYHEDLGWILKLTPQE